ncbi:MAG: flagellar export chaperone FliS [Deltaproteobacteria bacterium]|nr:flagellar export chaperone FliS [Deltaproteobacteria bacterium]
MFENGIGAYKRNDVVTAEPTRLIVMCYKAAINNLKQARKEYAAGRYEPKDKALNKARNIIGELMAALDFEKGGQIAKNLNLLYAYMLRRITTGDIERDSKAYDEVIEILGQLVDAWEGIIRPRAQQPAEQPQQPQHSKTVRSRSVA